MYRSRQSLNEKVNKTLERFLEWFEVNNLALNKSKTQAMLFKTTARNDDTINVYLESSKIESVHTVRFLGVNIDANLNWKEELDALESSIGSACYAIRCLRDELNIYSLKQVYFSLVESKIRYSIQFWGNGYKKT